MNAPIVKPTFDGLTRSVAAVADSAGRLISIPEYGTAARPPSNKVNLADAG
jgi:hypothetical protein